MCWFKDDERKVLSTVSLIRVSENVKCVCTVSSRGHSQNLAAHNRFPVSLLETVHAIVLLNHAICNRGN